MPFRTALSGLNAASADLRVIGNNVANAGTVGFKKSTVNFSDVFATSNLGTPASAIGSGVRVSSITQQFAQGNIEFTDNSLDLAISGQGFFRLNDGGNAVYTRSGAFGVDRNGFVINPQNQRLTGYLADSAGNITGALGDIRLDTSDIAPRATTTIGLNLNLNASATSPAGPLPSSSIAIDGTGGANPVLDETASPAQTPPFTLIDRYGREVSGQLQFTHVSGNDWTVELIGAGGTSSTANITVGASNTVSLSWDADGAAGTQSPIDLEFNVAALSQAAGGGHDIGASANGAVQAAFDPNDAVTFNNSTSMTIYDSLGASHLATMYYRQTGVPNQWESYLYIGDQPVSGAQPNGSDLLQFNSDGALATINGNATPPSTITMAAFNPGNGAGNISMNMDYGSMSQFGGGFNVIALPQDGYATGRLSGIDIDNTGVMLARFTNGQSRTLAQIALVNFSNPQGLTQLGESSWAESFASGDPLVSTPGASNLGLVESGALEGSNVDLTEQLVRMITSQRNFQANAQVISTADAITQSIINIR